MNNGSTFYAFSPLLFVGHVTGIAPFSFKIAPKKSKTELYIPTLSMAIFNLSLYICTFTYTIISDDIRKFTLEGTPKIYLFVEEVSVYAGCAIVVIMFFFRFRKKDNFAISFEYFNEIEELFKGLDCAIDYKRLRKEFVITVIMQTLMYVFYLTLISNVGEGFSSYERLPSIFVTFTPSYQIAIGRFICASFVDLIWLNLFQLNTAIRNLVHIMTTSPRPADDIKDFKQIFTLIRFSNKLNDQDILQKLDSILKAYAKICDCSIILNTHYSEMKLSVIFLSFLFTLFNAFSAMILLIGNFSKGCHFPSSQIVLHFVRCSGNVVNLFILINICNMCEREVTSFFSYLRQI